MIKKGQQTDPQGPQMGYTAPVMAEGIAAYPCGRLSLSQRSKEHPSGQEKWNLWNDPVSNHQHQQKLENCVFSPPTGPPERHSGQEPTDLQGFEDDPGVPGRSGSVVLELLLQSTPQPREVRGRVVSPRALVVNGTEGFREAAQLPEPVLDKLLWHL